jgi:hypothetical protein
MESGRRPVVPIPIKMRSYVFQTKGLVHFSASILQFSPGLCKNPIVHALHHLRCSIRYSPNYRTMFVFASDQQLVILSKQKILRIGVSKTEMYDY